MDQDDKLEVTGPEISIIACAFEDERGKIYNIIDREGIEHVAIIGSKKGTVRGNHYHPDDWQYIYMVKGSMAADYFHVDLKIASTAVVVEGQLEFVPPGWAHRYQFLEDSVFLNITPGDREDERFEQHTIKFDVFHQEGV